MAAHPRTPSDHPDHGTPSCLRSYFASLRSTSDSGIVGTHLRGHPLVSSGQFRSRLSPGTRPAAATVRQSRVGLTPSRALRILADRRADEMRLLLDSFEVTLEEGEEVLQDRERAAREGRDMAMQDRTRSRVLSAWWVSGFRASETYQKKDHFNLRKRINLLGHITLSIRICPRSRICRPSHITLSIFAPSAEFASPRKSHQLPGVASPSADASTGPCLHPPAAGHQHWLAVGAHSQRYVRGRLQ